MRSCHGNAGGGGAKATPLFLFMTRAYTSGKRTTFPSQFPALLGTIKLLVNFIACANEPLSEAIYGEQKSN